MEVELGVSEPRSSERTDTFTTGQPRPLLRFHVATSLSCPTIAVGLSSPKDLAREAIPGAGSAALTRPSDGREGRDILVPPIPGTEAGTARVCSVVWTPMRQRLKESEPSAGLNTKMSWKLARLCWCVGERGSRGGDE